MRSILFLFIFIVTGCATQSNEVSLKKMNLRERVYVGKINVNFNKKDHSRCEIYLNYDIAPSIKLSDDGYVFYKTDRDQLKFRSIACLDKVSNREAAWHHQKLNLNGISRPETKDQIAYFGTIQVDWVIEVAETREAALRMPPTDGSVREGQVTDSGELTVSVHDDLETFEKNLNEKVPDIQEKKMTIVKKIASKFSP